MSATSSTPLPRYGWRAWLGMLLLSGDVAAEAQFSAMLPDGVSLHTTRLKLTGSTNKELLAMTDLWPEVREYERATAHSVRSSSFP
jgi:maleate cis-trans isomerase